MQETLDQLSSKQTEYKPVIFDLSKVSDQKILKSLIDEGKLLHATDDYEEELTELFGVNNPNLVYTPDFRKLVLNYIQELNTALPSWKQGRWVYYPWRSLIAHVLIEDDFFKVRTARNKNLINQAEQEKFYNSTAGIGGLSVGSSIAYALVLQGGPKNIKLADMDKLALSNTNRVLAGVDSLGVLKVEMTARRMYEVNPYMNIEVFPEGINKDNIESFFSGLDIVIDELDNLAVKFLIRQQAKKNKIAVVMGADNGDNAVIDVERYDINPDLPYFHGRLGDVTYEELSSLDKFGIGRTITRHIGPENVTIRMQESLLEMGKTIVSWPQLGGAALVNGASIAYCVRKILNKEELESNRAFVSLDEKLDPTYNSDAEIEKRAEASGTFKKIFKL
jgi:hypothetical protein